MGAPRLAGVLAKCTHVLEEGAELQKQGLDVEGRGHSLLSLLLNAGEIGDCWLPPPPPEKRLRAPRPVPWHLPWVLLK